MSLYDVGGCSEWKAQSECQIHDGCFWQLTASDELIENFEGSCMSCVEYSQLPFQCGLTGNLGCKYSTDSKECQKSISPRIFPGANPGIETLQGDTNSQWGVATFSNLFVQELNQYSEDEQVAAFKALLLEATGSEFVATEAVISENSDMLPEQVLCGGEQDVYVPWTMLPDGACGISNSMSSTTCCVEPTPQNFLARSSRSAGVNEPFCDEGIDSMSCEAINRAVLSLSLAIYPEEDQEICSSSICGCIGKLFLYIFIYKVC